MSKSPPKDPKKATGSKKNPSPEEDFFDPFPEPVVVPIGPELDLHTFSPREIEPLLEDYLEACREKGYAQVKIIHGKGTGKLKDRVCRLLARHPLVLGLRDAEAGVGGWGATEVVLKQGPF